MCFFIFSKLPKIKAHTEFPRLKKEKARRYKYLENNIKILEIGLQHARPEAKILYDKYVRELQSLREEYLEGAIVRSRVRYLEHGDAPTKYFCGLEKRNYNCKVMNKLTLSDGTTITDQNKILKEQTEFYKKLYSFI